MIGGWEILWGALKLAAFLCAAGAIGGGLIVVLMALALLRPGRMSDAKALYYLHRLSPEDLQLPYESIYFMVNDLASKSPRQIRMTAWWIAHPQPSDKCAILLHGYGDAKVGGIAWAPLLRSLGFHILAVDLRAHGLSQGRYTTAGFYERHDLTQIIDQLKVQYPAQTRHIVLLGVSLGAAVACATALIRKDISAVILDCPYVDFPSAVLSHADNLGVPGRTFQRLALWLGQRLARVDYRQVRPVEMIVQVPCPIWIMQSGDDPFVRAHDQQKIAAAVGARTDGISGIWRSADSHHVIAMAEHPDEYRRLLSEFLNKAMSAPSTPTHSPRPLQPDGRLHGVVIACRHEDGRWLCIRRSQFVSAAPLKVCFPGGAVEVGETQEAAVEREMREEVGAPVRPVECVWRWDQPNGNLTLWGWKADLLSAELNPDPAEVAEILWLTSEQISNHPDALPNNRAFVARLEEIQPPRRQERPEKQKNN